MITGKLRMHKTTGQKVVGIPKQDETEEWKEGDLIELTNLNKKLEDKNGHAKSNSRKSS